MTTPQTIQRIYLSLLLGNTLAASMIWGINTIFLLNAGLSNFEAFLANAFFTLGQVLFEIPTGVIADTMGRRTSYLFGTVTLLITTLFYWLMWQTHASFWAWALVSMLLGLGFTFFSGAVEAWLVDALQETKFTGNLDAVFSKGQIVTGVAMLIGSVTGGYLAQLTNLGVPYLLRSVILAFTCMGAWFLMKDIGFTPDKSMKPIQQVRKVLRMSVHYGLQNKKIQWIMFSAPFISGISFYIFYALQPYLLNLYGDKTAYGIAGLTAAIVAGSQIVGGLSAGYVRKLFSKRTSLILFGGILSTLLLALMGLLTNFYLIIFLVVLWGLLSSAVTPTRQTYLNHHIPSDQRATVLSFDSLLGSSGGIVFQPILGKSADLWGYPSSYLLSAVFQLIAIPLLIKARAEDHEKTKTHSG